MPAHENMYQEPFKKGKYTDSCRHRECFNRYMRNCNAKRKATQIVQIHAKKATERSINS